MLTKPLISAVGKHPAPNQTELSVMFQASAIGYFGRVSKMLLQLTVPNTAKNGIVLQAQGSIDGKIFGTLVHRRLDDGTLNAAPTYLPSSIPFLLLIEHTELLSSLRFLYKTVAIPDPNDACFLISPDRS